MRRRTFLVSSSSLLTALAGCSGISSDRKQIQLTPTDAATTTSTDSATETQPNTPTSNPSYSVIVLYEGEWSGTVGTRSSMRSVDGTGKTTIPVKSDGSIIVANVQKRSSGSRTLTLQLRKDEEVVSQKSTTAQYGSVQITSQDGGSDGADRSSVSESEDSFAVKVIYQKQWHGSVSVGGSARSIEGSGTQTIDIDGAPSIISANAQKQEDNGAKLTVQILKNGAVVKEASTTASYGVAQVNASFY